MANFASFHIEFLAEHHKKSAFRCGNGSLDRYLERQAGQDVRRSLAATFVLISQASPDIIIGYYTLSATAIDLGELLESTRKKLPRYPVIPATLIGRLARDIKYRGSGVGDLLLIDALRRSLAHSNEVASFAVVVDAIDDEAHNWYAKKWGFISINGRKDRLYLPMKTIKKLFEDRRVIVTTFV